VSTEPQTPLVSIEEIRAAAAGLAGVVVRTPLLPFGPPLEGDPRGRPRAFLKPESLQPIGAFKLRGAYHALVSLTAEQRARGVVTHSSGNHAQGVARAARLLGIRAVVVMPDDAPAVKVAGVRADGAEIDVVGPAGEARIARADELAEREGLVLIPSYDDPRIIAGQGTAGLEIAEQLLDLGYVDGPATVLVPIGGGGLSSGVATAVRALRPDATILGVEPELAADARDSLREGRIVRWDPALTGRTSADGMRSSSLGRLTFAHLQARLDGVLTVSETEIARAMVRAARGARLVLEPSGATTLAAWLFHDAELPPRGPVVALLSGGNVDPDVYAELLAVGIAAGG
jgi:threo-3-hydroxy-L-aspartate ammonia-lyase